ncbi:hypothetical protein [Falsarthrobacter nasiphocae]|uniref:ABC-type multidrug transport system ATPase subunit n=1 Tax=Falsarthrobacter nasiphocae TaxID=189863 RepID=A0AAE3YGN2_9MICC|nr:hypothetical protein [Falsarthrobacter nasiphocae]MDR6891800.1 ABC-type multidrug transport system ATPase subunit [Falsarthrobacter nasiphocae]
MLTAHDLRFRGHHADIITPTSFSAAAGEVTLVIHESPETRTALGLILTDRMRPTSGSVDSPRPLRRRSALIDAPDITEPGDELTGRGIVTEAMALTPGMRTLFLNRRAESWMADHGLGELAREPLERIDGAHRLRLLTETALMDEAVDLLVLDSPDRHAPAEEWLPYVAEVAARGVTVVVLLPSAPHDWRGTVVYVGDDGCADQPEPAADTEPQNPTHEEEDRA